MVTILFCDVVGSVTLAEHLDPEDFLEIINGGFAVLSPCVTRNGGTLARLIGDALLAFFGDDATREDDPERAVRAALEMVAAAQAYGDQLARDRRIPGLSVHVGINTGLVVIGAIGTNERFEHTAMGDAVNVAARLQSAAPPGGILVSHDTYRLVRGRFDAARQPPLTVKGHAEPLTCYLITRAKSLAFPISNRGVEGVVTRMVGREAELVALENAYLDAFEGCQTRVVTVVGEAGIGKSRLLDEFFTWADLRPEGVYYWRGRATRDAQMTPYGLLRDLFARRFSIRDSDNAAAALARFREQVSGILEDDEADIAGYLAGFDFSTSPAVQALLGTPGFGHLARNALRKALQALWGLKPQAPYEEAAGDMVMLVLEDLHWSDDASLDLISELVAAASRARCLIIAAARPEFFERRPNWGEGMEAYWRLELRPLSRRGSALLVAEILQRVPEVPAELRDRLVEGADGNPFFLEELVKVLIDDGAIETGDAQWRVREERLARTRLPSTLSAVLQARLDALPPVEKLVLQRASVVGRYFWDQLVAELAPEVPDVTQVLSALRSRELVFRREQPAFADVQEYAFKHAVLQQVTYETVLLQSRRACHVRVARWIEARAGERLGEYLALIGGHYQAAGEGSQAARWFTRAGERAAALGANRDARGSFAAALELLPPDDLEGRWRALAAQDEVLGVLGDSEARQAADAALLELAKRMADDNRLADAHYRRGHYLGVLSRHEEAVEALDAALAAAQRAQNLRVEANALSVKVFILTRMGRMRDAAEIAGKTLACAEELGEPEILGRALSNVSVYFAAAGDLGRSAELLERQAEVLERAGNRVGQVSCLANLGYYYLLLGLYPMAKTCLEQTLSLAEAIAARRERLYNQLNLSLVCWRLGDSTSARHLLEDAIPQLAGLGDTFGQAAGKGYLGLVLHRDDPASALAAFEEAHSAMAAIGAEGYATDALAGMVRCHVAQGAREAARNKAEAVWSYLSEGKGGMEFPLMAHETCATAFEMDGRAELAVRAAEAGYALLTEEANKISDPRWRKSFLEDVAEHRALVQRHLRVGQG